MYRNIFLLVILLPLSFLTLNGQSNVFDFNNMVSARASLNVTDSVMYNLGGRYIPEITLTGDLKNDRIIDMKLSASGYASIELNGQESDGHTYRLKPYRMWIRYSTPRLEIRAGLQKISFGSASVLRPLMWFDKMDFRDPLQLTDGVYGLRGRYYFQNNVNIWLWALYGNEGTKGWEAAPTQKNRVEYGGRFQVPLFTGEVGLSYHYRKADFSTFYIGMPGVTDPFFRQDLFGLDAKWDIGPGIWFEYTLKRNDELNALFERNEHFINLGTDYTFALGNGLNVTTEYFRYEGSVSNNYSILALSYPFGLMNRLVAAVYYNWDTGDLYRFVNFQRDYDFVSLNIIAFWNPEGTSLYGAEEERNLMAGTGLQIMATVNF